MRTMRTKLKLTQAEVARRAGISARAYADYERGYRNIRNARAATAAAIAKALNTTVEELIKKN